MVKVLESIPDEFAKKYIAGEIPQTKSFTVDVELVDICEGNIYQAIILSRIVFWHRPNVKGHSRLRVRKNGHLWIARNHDNWFEECRIKKTTARKYLRQLEDKKLIISDTFLFNNKLTPHYRLNWKVFGKVLQDWTEGKETVQTENKGVAVRQSDEKQTAKSINLAALLGELDYRGATGKVSQYDRESVVVRQTL